MHKNRVIPWLDHGIQFLNVLEYNKLCRSGFRPDSSGRNDKKIITLRLKWQFTDDNLADSSDANRVVKQWWELADALVVKYDDGYINEQPDIAKPVGYPYWWLKEVGCDNGPITYKKLR